MDIILLKPFLQPTVLPNIFGHSMYSYSLTLNKSPFPYFILYHTAFNLQPLTTH